MFLQSPNGNLNFTGCGDSAEMALRGGGAPSSVCWVRACPCVCVRVRTGVCMCVGAEGLHTISSTSPRLCRDL